MYIAVKFWKDRADKPTGMPDAWPCETRELGDSRTLPDPSWRLMMCVDLIAYKAARQASYNAWLASQPVIIEEE